MPIHDWTRVDAGIFHAFHHSWIEEISRSLNRGLLPTEYYALAEQITGDLGPDVLTLRRPVFGSLSRRIRAHDRRHRSRFVAAEGPVSRPDRD